jgi:hypothetical protein
MNNLHEISDDELSKLMDKYKEKLERYRKAVNEETDRTEKKVLLIHLELVRRSKFKI